MTLLQTFVSLLAPIFLVVSPITSYVDQIISMHRTRSSRGFSLDIPLIMLTASIIKLFYWPGARFDTALLLQTLVMLVVQSILLKVALAGRATPLRSGAFEMKLNNGPSGSGGLNGSINEKGNPYNGMNGHGGSATPLWAPAGSSGRRSWYSQQTSMSQSGDSSRRPFNFWRWKDESIYWQYVGTLAGLLGTLHILIRPSLSRAQGYTTVLGALGLGIEALLPIPQLWQNYTSQSCKGFRLSVLVNWLFGDAMKMGFFFMSAPGMIPWSFKACGIFQACCDLGLGLQYWLYGEGRDFDIDGHFA